MSAAQDARRRKPQRRADPPVRVLPAWPIGYLLAGYPVWWILGVVDFAWIVFGALMLLLLAQHRPIRVPRGFGIWLAFMVWMTLSAAQLDTASRLIGFSYRYLIYVASTVLFIYGYNARERLTDRTLTGLLTLVWVYTVIGGYLGMLAPAATIRTPMSRIMPEALLRNDLVRQMTIRRFAQYNPEGFFQLAPRPSAPFLYTNNWGNVYSLLLPFVVVYLIESRGQRRFWLLLALIPASFIPAAATLNRGMFLGIAVAAIYLGFRYLSLGNAKLLVAVAVAGVIGLAAFSQTPWASDLTQRTENTGTNEARTEIYSETLASVQESPLFGMGAPRPSDNPNVPPVGSHGQFWIVLHSHGVLGMAFFMGWFALAYVRSRPRHDRLGLIANAVLLVGLMEALYYGFLPVGLMLLMLVAALALRRPTGKVADERDISDDATQRRTISGVT